MSNLSNGTVEKSNARPLVFGEFISDRSHVALSPLSHHVAAPPLGQGSSFIYAVRGSLSAALCSRLSVSPYTAVLMDADGGCIDALRVCLGVKING